MSTVTYGQLLRRNRNFRLFWCGQIVSQLGDWFSSITVSALLLKYTGSTGSLALLMIATMLPGLLLGPVAGVQVDRLSRKHVMVAADLARALIAFGFLFLRGPSTVWVGYACVAALQTFTAFFEPARIATLPNITSKEELVAANALSSVTWSILLTSGAMVGGVVGHFFGPSAAFVLNALSFLGSALLLGRLAVPPTAREGQHVRGSGGFAEGFRYVRQHPEILGALTAKLGWGLAGGIQILIPVFGAKVFPIAGDRDGQLGMSVLFAAGGLGTALGPVLARRWVGRDVARIRWAIAVSFVLGGVYYACLALVPNLTLTAVVLAFARFHGAIVWVFSTILLQMLTRDQYRGRVFAAETSLFTASMMLSSVLTSRALDRWHLGVPLVCVALGTVSLLVGGVWIARLVRGGLPLPVAAQDDSIAVGPPSTDG